MSAQFTKGQKAYLAMLTNAAYARARKLGDEIKDCGCHADPVTHFRHGCVLAACNKHGLRCCIQADYGDVKGYLLKLLGQDGQALKAMVYGADNARRQAIVLLKEACKRGGVDLSYADSICRRQNRGAGIQEIGRDGIMQLLYTVNNRCRQKARVTAGARR